MYTSSGNLHMNNIFREKMKTAGSEISTFTFGQDLVFDAFVQFKEYIGFVKAMNSLKGMKLLYKDRYEDRSWVANIKVWVYYEFWNYQAPSCLLRLYYALHYTTIRLQLQVDFDKTKHLAESTIKKRTEERESLAADEREREETERRQKHLDELKRSEEL